jgi:hypothetical protein
MSIEMIIEEHDRLNDEIIPKKIIPNKRMSNERIGNEKINNQRINDERISNERIANERMNVERINMNNINNAKSQINYDDILKNMGMRDVKGKLYWEKNEATSSENFIPYDPGQRRKNAPQQKSGVMKQSTSPAYQSPAYQSPAYQNSYIHNKYFKNEFKEPDEIQKPRNLIEYRNILIKQLIERKRIEQIKSRQMTFK